jgi:hypothetical protein
LANRAADGDHVRGITLLHAAVDQMAVLGMSQACLTGLYLAAIAKLMDGHEERRLNPPNTLRERAAWLRGYYPATRARLPFLRVPAGDFERSDKT